MNYNMHQIYCWNASCDVTYLVRPWNDWLMALAVAFGKMQYMGGYCKDLKVCSGVRGC